MMTEPQVISYDAAELDSVTAFAATVSQTG